MTDDFAVAPHRAGGAEPPAPALAHCRGCSDAYPAASLRDGRCFSCTFYADYRPVPVTDVVAPPAPDPVTLQAADPCVNLACMRLNLRPRTEPPKDVCPHCSGPTLYAGVRRRAVALDGDRSF